MNKDDPASLGALRITILKEISLGKTTKEIAKAHDRCPRNIEYHIVALKKKLNVDYKSELVEAAFSNLYGTRIINELIIHNNRIIENHDGQNPYEMDDYE